MYMLTYASYALLCEMHCKVTVDMGKPVMFASSFEMKRFYDCTNIV